MTAVRRRGWAGLLCYTVLTFALSWLPAVLVDGLGPRDVFPSEVRLAISASIYALCMGWQPLVATWVTRNWVDRVNLDDIMRSPPPRYFGVASLSPFVLVATAALILLVTRSPGPDPSPAAPLPLHGFWAHALLGAVSLSLAGVLIWTQALAEELGWRGYFLARLMHELGPLPGLALHGVVWGLWYAPILLIANAGSTVSGVSGTTFVVTCMLLGALLGWLRLASKSVVPTTLANSLLTITAGLPLIVDGADPGLRGAAYGPAGWLPMGMVLGLLFLTRLRFAIRTPHVQFVGQRTIVVVVASSDPASRDRTLH